MHLKDKASKTQYKRSSLHFSGKKTANDLIITATQKGGGREEEKRLPPHCTVLPLVRFPGVGGLHLAQGDKSQLTGTGSPYRGQCWRQWTLWSRRRTNVCAFLITEGRACWPSGSKRSSSIQYYVPSSPLLPRGSCDQLLCLSQL